MSVYRLVHIAGALALLIVSPPLHAQQEKDGPPREEKSADLVLRVRLVQAQPGKMTDWPEMLKDIKKSLTRIGREESFIAVEAHRIPADFEKKALLKIEEYAMQVEVVASPKNPKGYPVTLRWLLTPKGKDATKIVERATKLEDGNLIVPYVHGSGDNSQTLYLVLDIAPPWNEDPVAKEIVKKRNAKR